MIRFVALDMGGVLLENESRREFLRSPLDFRGREALAQFLARRGEAVRLEHLDEHLFSPWLQGYERREQALAEESWVPHLKRLRDEHGVTASDDEILAVWFRPYGEQLLEIAGAREALAELRRSGVTLALVSNVPFPGDLYRALLDRFGLLELLDGEVLFSYDFGSRKPSPAMLRSAMEKAGATLQESVMVGDRPTMDTACGLAAGVRTVWIESRFEKGPKADRAIASIADLPNLVHRWQTE